MKIRLVRDPVFHFFAIGTAIFVLHALFGQGTDDEKGIIGVNQDRIEHLRSVFERSWQRPPTAEELQGLIENHIREEVLYREALKLGLDKDDTVIRRRLRMKMEFLAEELVDAVEPDEKVLRDYFDRHTDDYREPPRFSFQQIYFDGDKRKQLERDLARAQQQLAAGADPASLGDGNLLQRSYRQIGAERIDRLFGENFAAQLETAPAERWVPVASAYGAHLVRIGKYEPGSVADFTRVRDQVLRDWQVQEQKNILQTQYEALRENYRVLIEADLEAPKVHEVAGK